MKHTQPEAFMTRELLCFVRDQQPLVAEFATKFGSPGEQVFHVLRKSGVIVVEVDRIRLNCRHLSPDGQRFVWGIRVIHLNEDVVDFVRWRPGSSPVWSDLA